ncbi:hypothetical protein NP493_61g05039 [Ridgeia piscesae]|uniref:Endonuclease/exonuclease/phosphatase domain-containing protein n=1 Tax=Ridgeia piscesae TaxID=27915 RepID=A0AAD9UJ32_RIDPI|nr:hypothetical protein NP493_61g05039 [Ridgeia piscesae]
MRSNNNAPGRTALSTPSLRNNLVQTVNRSNLISVKLQQHCTTNSLRAAVLNTRSACELDKCQQIQDLITENQLDICSLTETWFNPSHITVKAVVPPGYTMKHIPRANARGGGVAIIFRDCFEAQHLHFLGIPQLFIQSWSRTIANRNDIQTSTKSKVAKRSSISEGVCRSP